MIKIEKVSVAGFEPAIRGMRNPKNSWSKSDSHPGLSGDEWSYDPGYIIGPNDKKLAISLAKGGSVHAKYRRQIVVWCDITAPLYWWKEFDTYKVGTVANSCSTMHKIHEKEFTMDDFSCEHLLTPSDESLTAVTIDGEICNYSPRGMLEMLIQTLNRFREKFLETGDKVWWWQMIQLLPSSYNQKRTVSFSYENLASMECYRHNHKLDEWRELCKWAETLPYSWIFTTKPTREESVTYDDVEAWLDKHGKDLTPENRKLLIEMLEQKEEPVTDDLPDPNQYFNIDLCQEEIQEAVLNKFTPFPTSRMNLYLDGAQIGMLHSIERDDYALWRYKLHFIINPITCPESDPKFAERVRNVQKLWNSGELTKSIAYNNATGSFDLHLSGKW